jgi:phosphatidylserine/phosphatidylglycerophosphate/cardiolipin synthase-like enzyme
MDDAELFGGVLVDAADTKAAAGALLDLLRDPDHARSQAAGAGFDPDLVSVLATRLRGDPARVESACALGAAWVAGRRSISSPQPWDLVASLPPGVPLPPGLKRTTAETLIQLVAESTRSLRLVAPFIDWPATEFLSDALSAATARGVELQVVLPTRSSQASNALRQLAANIETDGDPTRFTTTRLRTDAPWAHLKVMSSDSSSAYIGSANVTGAGISGPNLELGILVRGPEVAVVEGLIDSFQER